MCAFFFYLLLFASGIGENPSCLLTDRAKLEIREGIIPQESLPVGMNEKSFRYRFDGGSGEGEGKKGVRGWKRLGHTHKHALTLPKSHTHTPIGVANEEREREGKERFWTHPLFRPAKGGPPQADPGSDKTE